MTASFDRATWAYLDAIAHDNTRAAFDATRTSYQDHVVAPSTAFVEAFIERIVIALQAKGTNLSDPDREKPPRPFAADHRNAELLRRDGFHSSTTHAHPPSIDNGRFPSWRATRRTAYRDFVAGDLDHPVLESRAGSEEREAPFTGPLDARQRPVE